MEGYHSSPGTPQSVPGPPRSMARTTIAERLAPCGARAGESGAAILPSGRMFWNRHMSSSDYRSRSSCLARLAALVAVCASGATAAGGLEWTGVRLAPPQDRPYQGTIGIRVDASDTAQGLFRVHELIPVHSGELTLLYPKWIPGNHSPSGPVAMLAGLTVTANGRRLAWHRDEYDVYAFRVDVPRGISRLHVDFQYLSGRTAMQRIQMTDEMLSLEWS